MENQQIDAKKFMGLIESAKGAASDFADFLANIDTAKAYSPAELRDLVSELHYMGRQVPPLVMIASGVLADLDQAG